MRNLFSSALCAALCLGPATSAFAQAGPASLRIRSLKNALNPQLSVIPNFLFLDNPTSTGGGFDLSEVELALQSDIDTYGRADLYIAFPTDEDKKVEVEEGYMTLTTLPSPFQFRAGRFFANFGRLNMVHEHELDQIDRPLALTAFLGDEHLRSEGAELSAVAAPLGLFTEASYAFLNDLGQEDEPRTEDVLTTPGGNTIKVRVVEDETHRRRPGDYAHVARLRAFADMPRDTSLEFALSGAAQAARGKESRKLAALDATWRWRPEANSLYRSFIWRSEALFSNRNLRAQKDVNAGTITADAVTTHRRGAYSYMEYQPLRRWSTGLRFDYSESADDRRHRSPTRALTPYLTFRMSEFNRLRAQYQHRQTPSGRSENRISLQWTVVLGPHGAHAY